MHQIAEFLFLPILQKNAKVVTIDGYEDVPENDEKSLMKAVAHQPVSVAIEAGGRAFQFYSSVSAHCPVITLFFPLGWRMRSRRVDEKS